MFAFVVSPVLELRDFVVLSSTVAVTRPLSMRIHQSEILLLTGKNGIGKTTLIRAVLGTATNWAGRIEISTKKMAYHAQGTCPFPSLTLAQIDLLLSGPGGRSVLQPYVSALSLDALTGRPLGLLSGGEAQRAKLALALAGNPELLLLDEPLSGIDQMSRAKIVSCIIENRACRSILWVEHELDSPLGEDLAGLSRAVMEAK